MSEVRKYWVDTMLKICDPVISNLAAGKLKETMPIECKAQREVRAKFTHLEALGRTLCGMGPWLVCEGLDEEEEALRVKYAELCRQAIDKATDPESPDVMCFDEGIQPICDAAFLAHGMLRGKAELIDKLDPRVKKNLADRMKEIRGRKPGYNNFLLFSAMVEALLCELGEWWDPMRVDFALRQHKLWYAGDGVYNDGQEYCWNYYNSYVIQPMYVDLCVFFADKDPDWKDFPEYAKVRARRYAGIQERLINPDGSFPPVGRSLAYRFGAFQHLSQMALEENLPENLPPSQVRCALTAMIKRVMAPEDTFDENGWLTIGFCGHQPGVGEVYISTGSLYLCSAVFLALGISPDKEFWSGPDLPWTSLQMWSGAPCEIDEALHFTNHKTIYDHDDYLAHGGKH